MKFRLFHVAAALAALAAASSVSAGGSARIGQPAPKFTLTTFSKEKVSLDDLRGKVVVLNYWATWCGPCRQEIPVMDAFYRRHKDQGFQIYAVATEDSVPNYKLRDLAKALAYPLVTRLHGGAYGILGGVPTSYVIDRKGVVRYAKAGAFDAETLQEVVLPLLSEPAQ